MVLPLWKKIVMLSIGNTIVFLKWYINNFKIDKGQFDPGTFLFSTVK